MDLLKDEARHFCLLCVQGRSYYTGGTDQQTEGIWLWDHSKKNITFNNWKKDEPDNVGGNEHVLRVFTNVDGQLIWTDTSGSVVRGSICEKSYENHETTTTTTTTTPAVIVPREFPKFP